ncbi:MAG: hypothetical protein HC849_01295 [Oscillatoriales cyanobacterium RU_3_3]|nr:hypothetical protein [Oscillatoriales cyanobacterium RU_3_3]
MVQDLRFYRTDAPEKVDSSRAILPSSTITDKFTPARAAAPATDKF